MTSPVRATGSANARAALVGNPSDAFGGATIAFALGELSAEVEATPDDEVGLAADGAELRFRDAASLVAAGRSGDYPPRGPLALLMAAAKRFADRLVASGVALDGLGFRARLVRSSIPPSVGLAGSSAIVIATLRALGGLFEDRIPPRELPWVALACEEELGIAAGPQDRVVQTYGGLVYMDFDPARATAGDHESLDPALLPPLVVAYDRQATSHSGSVHASVRERFEAGDREVVRAMGEIAELARAGREALLAGDSQRLGELLDRNLDRRREIYDLEPRHLAMVDAARAHGGSANYAGSGGAIVAFRAQGSLNALRRGLEAAGCAVIVPRIAAPVEP
jgi:glucuronokinase